MFKVGDRVQPAARLFKSSFYYTLFVGGVILEISDDGMCVVKSADKSKIQIHIDNLKIYGSEPKEFEPQKEILKQWRERLQRIKV